MFKTSGVWSGNSCLGVGFSFFYGLRTRRANTLLWTSGFHVYSGAESVDLGPRGRLAVRVFTIGAVIRVAVRATM